MTAEEKQATAKQAFVFLASLTSKRPISRIKSALAWVCELHKKDMGLSDVTEITCA